MGTFAETAIVDYRLLFADQGKQTSVFRFRLRHGHRDTNMETRTWRHAHGDMKLKYQMENGSPGDFAYFDYRLLIMQTEVCRLSVC